MKNSLSHLLNEKLLFIASKRLGMYSIQFTENIFQSFFAAFDCEPQIGYDQRTGFKYRTKVVFASA